MGTAGSTRIDVVLGVIRQYSLCIFRACIANVSPTPYCTITGTFSALEGLFPLGHLPHAVRDIELFDHLLFLSSQTKWHGTSKLRE